VELMDDPVRRRAMGEFGRKRVQTDLGWHITSRNLIAAYRRLCATASDRTVDRAAAAL
jgi:hypothetical protein